MQHCTFDTVGELVGVLNGLGKPEAMVDSFYVYERQERNYIVMEQTDEGETSFNFAPVRHNHPYQGYDDIVISSSLTVGKFIEMLETFPLDTHIKYIRLKGADNMVAMNVEEDGIVIHD
ncbi:hypothetical protein PQC06_gp110 [Aeromonas phage LAh10]|uniref:Uncharacterized protein n=1 Tax=Aeromonas phage LAh10 TaxID=2591025 RepID=A0A514A1Q9_9CAUD|nr:hypothetical protein PQC06_gp110 [Aeromonas phage LAh10]QDH47220.1 hypothetical protein LAh10_110 [Aeromonas phage LAh10]